MMTDTTPFTLLQMQVTIKAAGLPGGVMRISGKISSQVSQCSDRWHRDRTCPPPTPATS